LYKQLLKLIIIITIINCSIVLLLGLDTFYNVFILNTIGRKASTYTQGNNKRNKHTQTSMPPRGLEPTTPAFKRAKAVHALDSAATLIGYDIGIGLINILRINRSFLVHACAPAENPSCVLLL
jgi:hypothetical protein